MAMVETSVLKSVTQT